jgi:antibiotic biosynthesis monooxygenase (ABM) superfamily enzyme
LRLIEEGKPFTADFHTRVARTGFEQWFQSPAEQPNPPAWKQNMIVLLLLYPIVFLFGYFVQTPLLAGRMGLPFAIALFTGNVVSVLSLNYLVPWTSIRFSWWLAPSQVNRTKVNIAGAVLVSAIYLALIIVFWRLF